MEYRRVTFSDAPDIVTISPRGRGLSTKQYRLEMQQVRASQKARQPRKALGDITNIKKVVAPKAKQFGSTIKSSTKQRREPAHDQSSAGERRMPFVRPKKEDCGIWTYSQQQPQQFSVL
eukprot:m.368673 g.368673  ORF g.368673 m.368673 type:complete len:119 (-) comp46112_c0_seq1:712-1068(-)